VHLSDGPLPFRDETFDLILVDAPCSGLGTIRRDPDIRWRRSPDDLPRFAAAQRELLAKAASLVKRGGKLVYSTCSSEPEENADVVASFLEGHSGFTETRRHETLPFRDHLEAFFASVLERT
jgi:16S rRNA (cytosine967-C5)-methyltransferase